MRAIVGAALLLAAATGFGADRADDASEAPAAAATKPVHCIDLIRIRDSDIIDTRHMLFRMVNGDLYLNTLPHACPGLRKNDPYMLRTSLNRMCDLDIITVLHSNGWGFTPGASCGLGMFEKVTEEQVEMVRRAAKSKKPG
jgi:hypothetical protein